MLVYHRGLILPVVNETQQHAVFLPGFPLTMSERLTLQLLLWLLDSFPCADTTQ